MTDQTVTIDIQQGGGIITIDNPPANALSSEVVEAVGALFDQAGSDPEIKFIILTGQGSKVFASGADLKQLESFDSTRALEVISLVKSSTQAIMDCTKPTIAAINGIAFGGGLELALACDFRVAVENIKFGLPEITLAVMPGAGGTQLLPRIIGLPKARWMLLSGRAVNSAEALSLGLIDRVVPPDDLLATSLEMGRILAGNGPKAYAAIKQSLRNAMEMPLSQALVEESKLFAALNDTQDKTEGVRAFLEKRTPQFTGQ